MRHRSLLSAAASFLNEWRDTIFYSVLAAGLAADFAFHLRIPVTTFANCAEIREIARALAWSLLPGRNIRYALMGVFACESFFLSVRFLYAIMPDAPLYHLSNAVYVLMHMTLATIALWRAGGLKKTFDRYRDTLFDYPRKIKPPPETKKNFTAQKKRRAWRLSEAGVP